MTSIVLALLIILFIAAAAVVVAKIPPHQRLLYLPAAWIVMMEALWHIPPSFTHIVSGGDPSQAGLSATGGALDFVYLVCWTAAFALIARRRVRSIEVTPSPLVDSFDDPGCLYRQDSLQRTFKVLVWIALGCLVTYYPIGTLLNWPMGYAAGEYFQRETQTQGRLMPLSLVFQFVIAHAPAFAAVYMLLAKDRIFSRRNIIPLVILALAAANGLASGVRAFAVTPIVVWIAVAYCLRDSMKRVVVVSCILAVVLVALHPAINAIRESREFAASRGIMDRVQVIIDAYGTTAESESSAAVGRLDKAALTGLVYKSAEAEGYVWLKPLYAAPVALVPRFIWPNKPMIDSSDGTPATLLSFMVGYWMGETEGVSFSVGPGGLGYWMGGIVGVCLHALVGGAFIALLWTWAVGRAKPMLLIVLCGMLTVTGEIYSGFGMQMQTLQHELLFLCFLYPIAYQIGKALPARPLMEYADA